MVREAEQACRRRIARHKERGLNYATAPIAAAYSGRNETLKDAGQKVFFQICAQEAEGQKSKPYERPLSRNDVVSMGNASEELEPRDAGG